MWNLTKLTVKSELNSYHTPDGNENWSEIEYILILKRKPLYQLFYLFIPSSVIGLIGVFSFLLSFDREEKLNLPVTMLLTITVFMLAVLSTTPETSETIPLLSILLD